MKTKGTNRLLAVFICLCMVVGMQPVTAFAEGQTTQGLCEHHPEHTAECGYGEGQACEHKHSEVCYTAELICGYDKAAETAAPDSEAKHTHTQECYALDCPHERGEHDDTCGYAEAKPCGYICELCGKTDNGPKPKPGDETETGQAVCTLTEGCTLPGGHEGDCVPELPPVDGALVKTITSWTFVATDYSDYTGNEFAMPGVSMERQADFDAVVSMLPTGISAVIEGETEPIPVDVIGWNCPEYVRDENGNWPVTGEYLFTAELPEGYACDPLPTVKALLSGAELYEQSITGDGYSFDSTGKLTVTSSAGTRAWRQDSKILPKDLMTVEIQAGVEAIEEGAFKDCGWLASITIPSSVVRIMANAFQGCTVLESVTIPSDVTDIQQSAFEGCTGLKSIAIPASVTEIAKAAFKNCTGLENVTFAEGLQASIGSDAFRSCSKLTSITIPSGVTSIWDFAFGECASLVNVTFKGDSRPAAYRFQHQRRRAYSCFQYGTTNLHSNGSCHSGECDGHAFLFRYDYHKWDNRDQWRAIGANCAGSRKGQYN